MSWGCGHEPDFCAICGAKVSAPDSAKVSAISSASSADAHVVAFGSKPSTAKGNYRDPWFQAFWKEYPRKVGKKPAVVAFDKALKAGASPSAIIDAAKLYALAAKRNGTEARHIKYPAGWLNDERWTDELEDVAAATDPAYIVGTPEYEGRMVAEGIW